MHYYQHHIGDFIRDTASLKDSQAMAYLRLLWIYYESEAPLPNEVDVLAMRVGCSSEEVSLLLRAFFKQSGDVWVHSRCDREISSYKAMSEGGKKGAQKRWDNYRNGVAIGGLSGGDNLPNASLIATNNQEPITNNHKKTKDAYSPSAHLISMGVDESIVKDWLTLRKAKKAAVTETAINGIVREAKKAMWPLSDVLAKSCERGWTGFKAEWVAGEVAPNVAAANPGELITLPDGRQITRAQQDFLKRVMA